MIEFLGEFWDFLKERMKWWLLPIIFILLIVGALSVFGVGSAVAPLVYPMF